MTALTFLQKIWPDSGLYCIATPRDGGGFRHKVFDSISKAADFALAMDAHGQDVYYAMATLKQRKVWNEKLQRDQVRPKHNMAHLKVFFFEVDSGEGPDKYPTKPDALVALKVFVRHIGWPKPMVVSSGNGFHVYWPLFEQIEAAEYEPVVTKLKLLAKHYQFKLDTNALDISRVLRVVGTHNHKRSQALPVELLAEGGVYDAADLISAVDDCLEQLSIKPPAAVLALPDYLVDIGGKQNLRDYDDVPTYFDRIVTKCGALAHYQEVKGDVSEPYWYKALQLIRFCDGGEQLCHGLSKGYEGYSADETDRKLAQLSVAGIGPTLCDKFSEVSQACGLCVHRGKISTPLVLGRMPKLEEAIADVQEVEVAGVKVEVIPPPAPYKRVIGKGIFMTETDASGESYDVQIYDHDLYPLSRVNNERDGKQYTHWYTETPSDGYIHVELMASVLYDRRAHSGALAEKGVYLDPAKSGKVQEYMVAYIKALQNHIAAEQMFSRLGWRDADNKFVVGDTAYINGTPVVSKIETDNSFAESVTTCGTFEAWRSASEMLTGEELVAHQFAFGVAFGAPLMRFTNHAGGVIHMVGHTGSSKSAIQHFVSSVWGHPKDLTLNANRNGATEQARTAFVHTLNNLPVCAEEITEIPAEEMSALAYSIHLGKEKIRLKRDGTMRKTLGGWSTIMLSSGNKSMHELLVDTSGSQAKMVRILEAMMPVMTKYPRDTFERNFVSVMTANYGHAGRIYAAELTRRASTLRTQVLDAVCRIEQKSAATTEERVWIAMAGAVITGLTIAKELNLHSINVDAVEDYACKLIAYSRTNAGSITVSPAENVARYIDDNMAHMLALGEDTTYMGVPEVQIIREPSRSLAIRYEIPAGRMFISVSHLRNWMRSHDVYYADTIDKLIEQGVVLGREKLKVLGARTSYSAGQIRCIEVNIANENFSGGKTLPERVRDKTALVSVQPKEFRQ